MDAYVLALGWLARRELTERQIRARLSRRGCTPEAIEAAVARLRTERALDDRRVAGAFVRTAIRLQSRGPLRLRRDLEALGIDRAAAREAVDEALAETDELTLLRTALARRWRQTDPPDRANAARLFRALVRQGFAPDKVRQVLGGEDE